MDEIYDKYLEMYPIYKALLNNIEINIGKDIRYIELKNGEGAVGHVVYNDDVSNINIKYSLQKGKYSKILIDKLKQIYSIYHDVKIEIYKDNTHIYNSLMNSLNINIAIPCEYNKDCYLKLDIVSKQDLRIEAANNIKQGLVTLEENHMLKKEV